MKLSEHFSLSEFTKTSHKVDNTPPPEVIKNLTTLCKEVLEPLRAHFNAPVIITSGYRSPTLNKLVGGSATSDHVLGRAADLHVMGVANAEVWKWISANLQVDQIIAEKLSKRDGKAGWIHVSFRAGANRKQAISFVGQGKFKMGLHYVD